MSVPSDWSFVEVDEHLLGFEIFFQTPGTEFASEAGLFVAAPRRFDISGLHVIHPDYSGAEGLHHAKRFVDIASPDGGGKTVGRVVGDANRVGFAIERNHGRNRAEDFFASDAGAVFDVVENGGLQVIAFGKLLGAAAADGDLGLFLADFEIGLHSVILFFTDQRT